MRRRGAHLLLAGSAVASAAAAAESVGYRYDALGRLVRVERSGGPQSGVAASYAYDCSDNRREVLTGAGAPPAPPPPPCPAAPPPSPPPAPPPSPPPPPNRPPVAAADSFAVARCAAALFHPLANDSDPDGDVLALTGLAGAAVQSGLAAISGTTAIQWSKAPVTGSYPMTYTVADPSGGEASASVTVTVSGSGSGACPPGEPE